MDYTTPTCTIPSKECTRFVYGGVEKFIEGNGRAGNISREYYFEMLGMVVGRTFHRESGFHSTCPCYIHIIMHVSMYIVYDVGLSLNP